MSGNTFKRSEINCLVYEIVCNVLLTAFGIPTPEISLVTITRESFRDSQIKINKRHFRPGIIGLGFKEVPKSDLLTELVYPGSKWEFNKIYNATDIIRIAIFDLWVENTDRHSDNYNLISTLEPKHGKFVMYAIDHAFSFGGLSAINTFSPLSEVSSYRKLIESQYFKYTTAYINKDERLQILNDFITLIEKSDLMAIIGQIFAHLPNSWGIKTELQGRIIDFLGDTKRINKINQLVTRKLEFK